MTKTVDDRNDGLGRYCRYYYLLRLTRFTAHPWHPLNDVISQPVGHNTVQQLWSSRWPGRYDRFTRTICTPLHSISLSRRPVCSFTYTRYLLFWVKSIRQRSIKYIENVKMRFNLYNICWFYVSPWKRRRRKTIKMSVTLLTTITTGYYTKRLLTRLLIIDIILFYCVS